MNIKKILHAMYSAKAVYELRKTPIFLTILAGICFGILHMTPFTLRFFAVETYRFDQQIWNLNDQSSRQLLQGLPENCYVLEGLLRCEDKNNFVIGEEEVIIHFNDVGAEIFNGIIFMENHFIFVAQQQRHELSYNFLEGVNFGDLQNLDEGYNVLFTLIASALRATLIVPFVFNVYQSGILTYFVYILGVSALSMLLKFGNPKFLSFKEVFTIMVFASLFPIVIMITVGIFIPAFSLIIFNMGTPLWAYLIYKKYVISELQTSVKISNEFQNEEAEEKECD